MVLYVRSTDCEMPCSYFVRPVCGELLVSAKIAKSLAGVALPEHPLQRCDLSNALMAASHLAQAHLSDAKLNGAIMSGANLTEADFRFADASSALLMGANLTKAMLEKAKLTNANLVGANLTQISARKTDVSGANFSGAFHEENGRPTLITIDWLKNLGVIFDESNPPYIDHWKPLTGK